MYRKAPHKREYQSTPVYRIMGYANCNICKRLITFRDKSLHKDYEYFDIKRCGKITGHRIYICAACYERIMNGDAIIE